MEESPSRYFSFEILNPAQNADEHQRKTVP